MTAIPSRKVCSQEMNATLISTFWSQDALFTQSKDSAPQDSAECGDKGDEGVIPDGLMGEFDHRDEEELLAAGGQTASLLEDEREKAKQRRREATAESIAHDRHVSQYQEASIPKLTRPEMVNGVPVPPLIPLAELLKGTSCGRIRSGLRSRKADISSQAKAPRCAQASCKGALH